MRPARDVKAQGVGLRFFGRSGSGLAWEFFVAHSTKSQVDERCGHACSQSQGA